MANSPDPRVLRDLGDGLILRRGTAADREPLVDFNGRVLADPGSTGPDLPVAEWTRELAGGSHPTVRPADFTIVENVTTGDIVSSLVLIPQTWSYGGVEFGLGRVELVGTDPAYRRRGLIRAQFEVIHDWCVRRGLPVQGITGIPWYYRQFGYEMALDLGRRQEGFAANVPKLQPGETEPYLIRPAAEPDLPFIGQVYQQGTQRYRVACVRDRPQWQRELYAAPGSVTRSELYVIDEAASGEPAGFFALLGPLSQTASQIALCYECKPGVSWLAVTPSVIRAVWDIGQEKAARQGKSLEMFAFAAGREDPVYRAAPDRLPRTRPSYAWYIRVADLPGFIRHVAPALERMLSASVAAGHSGELKLSFFRSGLRLVLERGRLARAEPWDPMTADDEHATFPGLTFLQLLFGYRSLEELRYSFADCRVRPGEPEVLLDALFPKQPSVVWPLA